MKRIIALILTIILIFVFAGCKDKSDVPDNSDARLEQSGDKHVDSGDKEISVFSYKPDTFCPVISRNNANLQMLNIVFEGLILLDSEMLPQPQLAENWSVSEDGSEWTVSLRNDVKWHSGEAFTSRDVVYTVNQIKNNAESFYFYNVSCIDEVTAQGQNSVVFRLSEPNPNFVSLLYFPVIKYDDADIEKESYRPIGTGPYVFEDRNEGNIYYLTANGNWWNGKAATDVIKVKLLPDKDTALYAFSSGSIDMTLAENFNWGKSIDKESSSPVEIKSPVYNFVGINHNNTVLAMEEVRTAISYALDRDEIIDEVMMGNAVPASAPVREEWFVCGGQKFEFKQDTKLARETLLENGWKLSEAKYKKRVDGRDYKLKFDILINDDNTVRANMAQIIEKNLEEFGMEISITKVPYETYVERINNGQYDAFIGSCFVPADLKPDFVTGNNNALGFQDKELDFVMGDLKTKTAPKDIIQSYAEVINLFNQLNPVVGLMFENQTIIYNNRISGKVTPSYFDIYEGIEGLYIKGVDGD